ncbi:hypothetical protein EURHEDRAFT_551108 [Aspergillus niger]|uniref:Transcription factor domain-containing protein n=1 Tax=Aspergillus niger TaxID=5061 RepID=A0A100IKP1_ASPNG|nr:hypothetical protein EURHEDRAFT_551108 [Aspergillus niger]
MPEPLRLTLNDSQLKCGRERPTCTRCERLSARCNYPRPPNRRGPRGRRLGTQRRRNEAVSQQTSAAETQKSSPIPGYDASNSVGPNARREDDPLLPSSAGLDDTSAALALAYRSCHLLGYSRKSTDNNDYYDESLESELSRRCFWACWTSTCIVMEPEPYIKLAWQEVGLVPLPGLISNTSSGYTITLNQTMDENWISRSLDRRISSDSYPGSAAILMKMVGVWAKIQQLCKEHTSAPNAQNFGQLEKLSHLATSLFDESTTLRNSGHQNDPKTEGESLLLVHDALYHQCQIAAHWMIVPLLSGIPTDPTIRSDKQRESADTVLKHAELLERLLAPYLYGRSDISRLPPLVGFGAFVAGIVLLATEISRQDCGVNGSFTKECRNGPRIPAVRAIVHLLDHLRVYWRALERPWETLNSALSTDSFKYKRHATPMIVRGDRRVASSSDCERLEMPSGYNQSEDISSKQLQPSEAEIRTGELEAQLCSSTAPLNGNGLGAPDVLGRSGSPIDQVSLSRDYDWYSLSFAEAGLEQFAGLEPSTLFQQGWGWGSFG